MLDVPGPKNEEHIVDAVEVFPSERVKLRTEEKIVDVPVPGIGQEFGEVIQLSRQERLSDRIAEQLPDVPGPLAQEQNVGVVKVTIGEIIDVPVTAQRQVPTVQAVQKTVEVPEDKFLENSFLGEL